VSDLLPVPPPLSWRARAEALLGGRALTPFRLAAALAGLIVVVGFGGLVAMWVLRTPPPTESLVPLAPAATAVAVSQPEVVDGVVVQAAGAVVAPGVYRLPNDARVVDLIDAAGGLAPGADPNRLALAAKVSDGERVYVPVVGEVLPSAPAVGAGTSQADSGPVDLNTATETDLDALPGIGPATATAIIAHRDRHGPFTSVDQLLEVRGIGPAKLEQLEGLVTV
jgi:competence protein ComEA